jgi:hypothetical protein
MTFIRELTLLILALLGRLALVEILQRSDEFWWNLYENGKFYVDSV